MSATAPTSANRVNINISIEGPEAAAIEARNRLHELYSGASAAYIAFLAENGVVLNLNEHRQLGRDFVTLPTTAPVGDKQCCGAFDA